MSEWQPIKTAPKDGTPVDLWVTRHNPVIPADAGFRVTDAFWGVGYGGGKPTWLAIGDGDYERVIRDGSASVTHWMPLTKPPVTVAGK